MSVVEPLPKYSSVVVVGGGIVGCAAAYQLARRGVSDVVLVERNSLTSGTTWHAAGVVGSLRPSVFLTRLTAAAGELFPALEEETGLATGYRRTGGLSIAQTSARLQELERVVPVGTITGHPCSLLSPAEIEKRSPLLAVDDLVGGLWIPGDGQTNPTDTTLALAKGARLRGAKLFEHVRLLDIERTGRRVTAARTSRGTIACDYLVLCSGLWTRHLGNELGVAVPLQAVEHMYVVTEPMAEVPFDQPFIRDLDASIYIKGDAGKLLIGSVDPVSKPWAVAAIPDGTGFTQLPEDWDHFEPFMEAALRRVPALAETGIRQFLNGPESFTVDTRHVIGPAPGCDNLFVAAGFNTTGIMSSAGAGDSVAAWIVDGRPCVDTWEVDPRRFERWTSGERFVGRRILESPGLAFAMHWPHRQPESARGVKQSVVHERLRAAGAEFGVVAGWERPLWYQRAGESYRSSFGRQDWWRAAAREARATAESVALYDQSQMAVFLVEGRDALETLQQVCANSLDVPHDRIVYTQMLNQQGGIEADVTVTRLGPNRFRVVTGAPFRVHDLDWLRAGLQGRQAACIDLSGHYAIFALMGPGSRELLACVSSATLDGASFAFGSRRTIEIGHALVEAQRLSYVGELGFELFVPVDQARYVYDRLLEAGERHDLMHAGLLCMDSCRIEKGFRHWGHELSPSVTPLEAGLGFAVDFDKPFVGRRALLRQREAGLRQRVVLFAVDGEPLLMHDEAIIRDEVLVGETTSGARAFRVGGALAFGLVRHPKACTPEFVRSGHYHLQVGDRVYEAKPLARAPYDPSHGRMRA